MDSPWPQSTTVFSLLVVRDRERGRETCHCPDSSQRQLKAERERERKVEVTRRPRLPVRPMSFQLTLLTSQSESDKEPSIDDVKKKIRIF